ncbi:MAG TPA: hypothetical protein VG937_14070 [Polyangiaceae bacterium]|nr:hypothetical protein [Polyangiaceae bacterium]
MFKQMVVVSSLVAGIGAAGMAMYLQANPLALSHGSRVNLDTYLYSAKTEPLPKSEAEATSPAVEAEKADVVVLPEVVVTRARASETRALSHNEGTASGDQGMAADPARTEDPTSSPQFFDPQRNTTPAAAPRELRPCSKFRELGPMHVDDGVPTGARGVRDLC